MLFLYSYLQIYGISEDCDLIIVDGAKGRGLDWEKGNEY